MKESDTDCKILVDIMTPKEIEVRKLHILTHDQKINDCIFKGPISCHSA